MNGLQVLLIPPIAFVLYIALSAALSWIGRGLAGQNATSPEKRTIYASGEAPAQDMAVPGYRPFFQIALFFAVLHLGALMIGSTVAGTPIAAWYVVGLVVVLAALVLG